MSLSIQDPKEREIQEMIRLVRSAESCCFRKTRDLPIWALAPKSNEEKIVATTPSEEVVLKLLRQNTKLFGWISSTRASDLFNRALDVYLNNQFYYQQKYKEDVLRLRSHLTDLEMWFGSIIEPPPKVPPLKTKKDRERFPKLSYAEALDDWVRREHYKYKYNRSYYCPEEVLKCLDKSKLLEHQPVFFKHYHLVQKYFKQQEAWLETIES
jgi:hypothetical protein